MTFSELNYAMNWMGNYIEFAKQDQGGIGTGRGLNTKVHSSEIAALKRQLKITTNKKERKAIQKKINDLIAEAQAVKKSNRETISNMQNSGTYPSANNYFKGKFTTANRAAGRKAKLKEYESGDLQSKYDSLKLNRDTLATIAGKHQKSADANKRESGRFRKIAGIWRDRSEKNLKSKKFWKKVGIGAGIVGGLGTLGMGALALRNANRYKNLHNAMGQTWGGRRALRKAGY